MPDARQIDSMPSEKRAPHIGDSTIQTPPGGTVPRKQQQADADIQELVFWDENNPRCLVNLLTEKMKANALKLPPHFLGATQSELEKKFEPSILDRQLRIAFWDEYSLTQDNGAEKMRPKAIYSKICTRETFHAIIDSDLRYAWLLCPPKDYMYQMRSLLEIGLDRLQELLKMPFETEKINPKTNQIYKVVNTKLVAEQIKAIAILDNRVRGAVPQFLKIQAEQKNLHVHAHAGQARNVGNENNSDDTIKTHQQIMAELAKVQNEIKAIAPPNYQQIVAGTENDFSSENSQEEFIDVTGTTTKAEET